MKSDFLKEISKQTLLSRQLVSHMTVMLSMYVFPDDGERALKMYVISISPISFRHFLYRLEILAFKIVSKLNIKCDKKMGHMGERCF